MKQIISFVAGFALCGLIAAAPAVQEFITAKRFSIFNDDGKPAVVATTTSAAGDFRVFDDKGEEVFGVRGGVVHCDRLDAIESRLADLEHATSKPQALSQSKPAPTQPRSEPAKEPAAPTSKSVLDDAGLRVLVDAGFLVKLTTEPDEKWAEAWVALAKWSSLTYEEKQSTTWMLWQYVSAKHATDGWALSVRDNMDGKQLARWSHRIGFVMED